MKPTREYQAQHSEMCVDIPEGNGDPAEQIKYTTFF